MSTNSPAPGGGSVAALAGALGAALSSMVAALTHEKKEMLENKPLMDEIGVEAQKLKDRLAVLVEEDTKAFNSILAAFRLSEKEEKEKKIKEIEIQKATLYAIQIPLNIMKKSLELMKLIETLVQIGNPNSVSDVGVAALCARSAVIGAYLNVLINAKDYTNKAERNRILKEANKIKEQAVKHESVIIKKTLERI